MASRAMCVVGSVRAIPPIAHKFLLSQFHTCPETSLNCDKWTMVRAASSIAGGRRSAWSSHFPPLG